jgi:hypothetical protein
MIFEGNYLQAKFTTSLSHYKHPPDEHLTNLQRSSRRVGVKRNEWLREREKEAGESRVFHRSSYMGLWRTNKKQDISSKNEEAG